MTIAAQVSDVAHGPYAKQKTNLQLMFWEAIEYYFYLVLLFIDVIYHLIVLESSGIELGKNYYTFYNKHMH